MNKHHFLLALSVLVLGTGLALAKDVKSSFERLIDVDYSFFMTKEKTPWGVDPFLKEPGYATVSGNRDKFDLNGVIYSEDEPMAIVNGKNVGVGDVVGDRVVKEIGQNYVILKNQASEIEINLPPIREADPGDADDEEDAK